jgi:hypothetical protein
VRHTVGTEFISRITVWVLVLLGRVSRTVGAANVAALGTCLVTGDEESRTFVAGSSHTLARLLMNQVLATGLTGSGEDDLLLIKSVRVVGNDGSVLLVGFDDGGTSFTAGNDLGLASLGRVAGTLSAASMLAARTLLGGRKGCVALVTGSSYAHTDRLVNAKNGIIGRPSLELRNVDIKPVTLAEFLSTLLNQLTPRQLGNAFQAFIFGLGVRFLDLRRRSLAVNLLVTMYIKFELLKVKRDRNIATIFSHLSTTLFRR